MDGYIKVRIKDSRTGVDAVECYQHIVGGEVVGYVDAAGGAVAVPDPREETVIDPTLMESLP